MNLIPVKDQIRHETCCHFLDRFSSLGVGAYGIRPTNASAWGRMTDKPDTFWGVCLCDQPHLGEKLLKFVWMHAKPGEDWMKMAISTENPAGIGFNMDTAIESSPGIEFHTFSRILFWARMGFVYPHAGLYLFYIGGQMARTGVNVSRQESRATRGMRSAVCVRQSFTLRFPSLAHSPSPSYC